MGQITLNDLIKLVNRCKKDNVPLSTPVFIGDDDELNGIHCAWYAHTVSKNTGDENEDSLYETIGEYYEDRRKSINILIS